MAGVRCTDGYLGLITMLTEAERRLNERVAKDRWRKNNPEKVRAYGRKNAALYRERHADRLKESKLLDYQRHRASYIEKARQWRLANPDRYKAHMRAAYLRRKAIAKAPRCCSCESLLEDATTAYCKWCIRTYQTCLQKNQVPLSV